MLFIYLKSNWKQNHNNGNWNHTNIYKDYEISQTLLKSLSHVITVMSDKNKGSHFNSKNIIIIRVIIYH